MRSSAISAAVAALLDGFRDFPRAWGFGLLSPLFLVVFAYGSDSIAASMTPPEAAWAIAARPLVQFLVLSFFLFFIFAPTYVGLLLGERPRLMAMMPNGKSLLFAGASLMQMVSVGGAALVGFGPFMLAQMGRSVDYIRQTSAPLEGAGRLFGFDLEAILDKIPLQDLGISPLVPLLVGGFVFFYLTAKLALLPPLAVERGQLMPVAESFRKTKERLLDIIFGSFLLALGMVVVLPILLIPSFIAAALFAKLGYDFSTILAGTLLFAGVGISFFTILASYHRRLLVG